ncbi:hypothetical protein O3P69_017270 [Scylla paramamosain]|uniref:Uncharacterized protein n=1 Tax=Scylla paramamosain TaxID=85552 RepID=A0AAW0TV06_SCYPA
MSIGKASEGGESLDGPLQQAASVEHQHEIFGKNLQSGNSQSDVTPNGRTEWKASRSSDSEQHRSLQCQAEEQVKTQPPLPPPAPNCPLFAASCRVSSSDHLLQERRNSCLLQLRHPRRVFTERKTNLTVAAAAFTAEETLPRPGTMYSPDKMISSKPLGAPISSNGPAAFTGRYSPTYRSPDPMRRCMNNAPVSEASRRPDHLVDTAIPPRASVPPWRASYRDT